MNNQFVRSGIVVLVATIILSGAYIFIKRLLHDRDVAMAYHERPISRINTPAPGTRTVTKYNSKDLEEARKKGNVSANAASTQSNSMNDAVQRNLRTLDEINRMNQMNQRLMEQQERMRRQTKN